MTSIPYSQLARIYDKVMSHVNYKMWAAYVEQLFRYSGIPADRILDLSCGTGKHLTWLYKKYSCVGADLSWPMLLQARKKLPAKAKVGFFVNDGSHIALKAETFSAVFMLYDSVNYLLETESIIRLFNEVERTLKAGGLFIFDFVTRQGLQECFDKDYFESNSWGGLAYERHSWFNPADNIQHNKFYLLYRGISYIEEHLQKIRELEEWQALVKQSRLILLHEFENFTLDPPGKSSERIHFVCRKAAT